MTLRENLERHVHAIITIVGGAKQPDDVFRDFILDLESIYHERDLKELAALLLVIPKAYRVRVCEGGGLENLLASLAVSLTKWRDADAKRDQQFGT